MILTQFSTFTGEAPFQFKGVAYVSFQDAEYLAAASTESLNAVGSTGANYVSILATWYMPAPNSNTIASDSFKTPSDDAVRKAIQDAHARGLKVMLKPHVDVADGSWRGAIAPANISAWFASYQTFITHYASIAQSTGCELFCVGCEFKTMSSGNLSFWTSVIDAVRASYSGPLTYAANANFPVDEFSAVVFWPQLDFAGLDVYTPLTSGTSPAVPELIAAWTSNRFGVNQLAAFRNFAVNVGKPVLFTEMGYQSADGANITPNDVPNRVLDLQEQADCYEAALTVFSAETWLKGIFFWGWEATPINPATDSHFSPRGKPAQTVLASFYQAANRAPVAGSGLIATPSMPKVGDTVQFTSSTADADGDVLTYLWDFGNGLSSTEPSPTHVFASAGSYTISVTVSDGKGGSVLSQLTLQIFADFQTMSIQSCTINLNFAKAQRDTIRLNGTLPLAETSGVLNANITYNFGGISGTATTDARGRSLNEARTVSFKVSPKARRGQTSFSLAISRSSLAGNLDDEGLIDADVKNGNVTISLVIQASNVLFQQNVNVTYSANAGRSVRARLLRE